jgi:hypothetical protein
MMTQKKRSPRNPLPKRLPLLRNSNLKRKKRKRKSLALRVKRRSLKTLTCLEAAMKLLRMVSTKPSNF